LAPIKLIAGQEKRLPGGGLLQRFMVGLDPDAPPGDPPEGQQPASAPASEAPLRSGAGDVCAQPQALGSAECARVGVY
jgi:hypothetical protein